MLSPWETPLKLSLYVIYTENKAWAKNHRECLFKHNSHGPWKMIKACSLIVNIHIFRISSFKMELLHLMLSSQYNQRHFLTNDYRINLRNNCQERDKKNNLWENKVQVLKESSADVWIIECLKCLEKTRHLKWTQSNVHALTVDFWSLLLLGRVYLGF